MVCALMECVLCEQYIADKIDSGSEMPAKPVIAPEILQEEWEFARSKR
jgi:hypothetical protein